MTESRVEPETAVDPAPLEGHWTICAMLTIRSLFGKGRGRSSTELIAEKTALLAPIPSASVSTTSESSGASAGRIIIAPNLAEAA